MLLLQRQVGGSFMAILALNAATSVFDIFQGGMSVLAQAQNIALNACLPGQKEDQHADDRHDI